MKKFKTVLWGVVLVAIGVIIGLKAAGITDFDIFFDGWWTLFIIVPSVIELFTSNQKISSVIGVFIGVFLLLCCRDIIEFEMIWKLGVPVIIVAIGLKMIFAALFNKKEVQPVIPLTTGGTAVRKHSAIFAGEDVNYAGEMFNGAALTAIFGGITCDLRGAVIENDCTVKVSSVFGGADIYVPEGVNVKITSTSFFGGASSEKHINLPDNTSTVYVKAFCLFGGVDVM